MSVPLPQLALRLILAAAASIVTPPGPDLMALYDKAPQMSAAQGPQVTVGLGVGLHKASLRSDGATTLVWHEAGIARAHPVPAGGRIVVRRIAGTKAPGAWLVPLAPALPFTDARALDMAQSWRRILAEEVVEQVVGGLWPQMDLRYVRPALRRPSFAQALTLREQLLNAGHLDATAVDSAPEAQRLGYPAGRLGVMVYKDGAKGHAGSRFVVPGAVTLLAPKAGHLWAEEVAYAMGYPWAGVATRRYRGELSVVLDGDGAMAIVNTLPMEALLLGVVPSELPAGAPGAALRAQAVAARSYMLWNMGRRHGQMPFHFCAEQHCQVYAGLDHEDPRSSAAVQQTQGAVMMRDGRVVNALYSASCGGHTEDNDVAWAEPADPALRGVDDGVHEQDAAAPSDRRTQDALAQAYANVELPWCGRSAMAKSGHGRWRRQLEAADIALLGKAQAPELGPLHDVVPGPRGPGGRLAWLTLVGARGSRTIMRELPIRRALGGLHSAAVLFAPEHRADGSLSRLGIMGMGWGHGVGLCQMGAIARAEAQASHADILAHYYSGAQVQAAWPAGREAAALPSLRETP